MTTMTTQPTEVRNLPALIRGLDAPIERAQREYHAALVRPAQEALEIAASGFKVYAGMNAPLEHAIASIRAGNLNEAVAYIEIAQKIQAAWFGGNPDGSIEPQQ
jgi:hypothetical protein